MKLLPVEPPLAAKAGGNIVVPMGVEVAASPASIVKKQEEGWMLVFTWLLPSLSLTQSDTTVYGMVPPPPRVSFLS